MPGLKPDNPFRLRILESPGDMVDVENLQRIVWPGNETDVVPAHLLLAAVHNGGLVIGVYDVKAYGEEFSKSSFEIQGASESHSSNLVGFVFGFPGLYKTPDGPRLKHCSHMLGVHPDYRDKGLGFSLKRAQWQMVRHQGMDLVTWTYDPLLSRNANLNIAGLGAVCDTYLREAYGEMHDGINEGLPSDRFQVDWWVNSQRVERRLSKRARRKLDLAHFLAAEVPILNPTTIGSNGLPRPSQQQAFEQITKEMGAALLLLEIPADFLTIKPADPVLAMDWRMHMREYFEGLFQNGYLVTDFIYLPGTSARSFYVLSHGMSTL